MLIGLGENAILDAFKVTRSNVKVTWLTFVINYEKQFLLNIFKTTDYKA